MGAGCQQQKQNVLALKTKVPFKPFQVFKPINVEHGNSSVYICVFWGTMRFSISTLTQNRENVMSSRRRKISWMSCEVCGSVRKHDPTHTHIHTIQCVNDYYYQLLRVSPASERVIMEEVNGRVKESGTPSTLALIWHRWRISHSHDLKRPQNTHTHTHTHTSTILRMGP